LRWYQSNKYAQTDIHTFGSLGMFQGTISHINRNRGTLRRNGIRLICASRLGSIQHVLCQIRQGIGGSGHGVLTIIGKEVMFHPCESKQSKICFSDNPTPLVMMQHPTPCFFCFSFRENSQIVGKTHEG